MKKNHEQVEAIEALTWKTFFLNYVLPCACGLLAAFLLTKYVVCTAFVPSGSMEPTIMTGEKVFVNYVHNMDRLAFGDIVVFKSHEFDKFFVKRLIGMPGDTVELLDGGPVRVNGELLTEPYVVNVDVYQTAAIYEVPEDHYFFLGDNRLYSSDARVWNNPFISEEDILGTPFFVFSPLSEMRWLP